MMSIKVTKGEYISRRLGKYDRVDPWQSSIQKLQNEEDGGDQ